MPPVQVHVKFYSACFDIALRHGATYTALTVQYLRGSSPPLSPGRSAMRRQPRPLCQRLTPPLVGAFDLVTLVAIGLAAFDMMYGLAHVPLLGRPEAIRDVQGLSRLLEEVVSAKLLNLPRVGVLL